ncbi:hypothetical protein ETB97_003411 [Aspergillus alliaceus]|uniref:D-isomer specific 2-hydroxyacid dehydrogenase NAD-binding domain-containing protein n=1 Tax=Petromyces alliaceus TaxID=209559 RepID=A0A8H6ABV9_PETAA|nr:hypothetical protein ETB97_003411 [Aspergillus burnettii]
MSPEARSNVDHTREETLDELLRVADVVTLHDHLVEDTRSLVGEHELSAMKDSAFLVNCARGGVVNERALLKALEEKRVGGAALDTTETEPPTLVVHGAFLKHDNVIITAHIGGSTKEN